MKGDIVHIADFEFSDGTHGNKYAVILNSAAASDPILIVKTTSNPARYPGAVEGCNQAMKVFLLRGNTRQGLPVDTYIQLNEIFAFPQELFADGRLKKKIEKQTFLPDQIFNAVKNCLKLLKEDIPAGHFEILFGKK